MRRTSSGCFRAARGWLGKGWVALCLTLLLAASTCAFGGPQQAVRLTYPEIRYYEAAKPVTTWTSEQLLRSKLGLKGLAFSHSQKPLPAILQKTGETVDAFFRDFTNTESVETIVETHLNPVIGRSGFGASEQQKFNYLFLSNPGGASLDEYRTDSKGHQVESEHLLPGAAFVTEGFASLPALFLPARQPESIFRYLGEQKLDKRRTLVVAFAQRPRAARLVGAFNSGGESVAILLQGIAWIAVPDYQIIRFRTDMLAPRADVGLDQETTDIRFKDIHFKQNDRALWLPVDVAVTIGWQGEMFENRHHYSDFKSFQVTTAAQAAPHRKKAR